METLLIVLAVLSVIMLMSSSALIVYVYFRAQELDEVLEKATQSILVAEDTAAKIAEAHNGLSKRVIELGGQMEAVRNKVEFQGQLARR